MAKMATAVWKKRMAKAIEAGKPPPPKPAGADAGPAPHIPRLVVTDATIERLGVVRAAQPKGALQLRDALDGWLLGMMRCAGENSDRPFWLEAYGRRSDSVEPMSREPLTIPRGSVGVVDGIQPDRLKRLLLKADDDGLLARFISVWLKPTPIKRPTGWGDDGLLDAALARLAGQSLPTGKIASRAPGSFRLRIMPATSWMIGGRRCEAKKKRPTGCSCASSGNCRASRRGWHS